MNDIIIRKGKPEDAQDFSQLLLFTGPMLLLYLFGSNVRNIMKNLFQHTKNYFGFEHSYFVELNDKIAGMALAYDYKQKKQESLHMGLLLLKYLKWSFFTRITYLLKLEYGKIRKSECYLSNIAVYPEFRGLGLGKKLLEVIEKEARKAGNKRIVLDVEIDNKKAIRLYESFGYKIEKKWSILKIKDKYFKYLKMSKDIGKIAISPEQY